MSKYIFHSKRTVNEKIFLILLLITPVIIYTPSAYAVHIADPSIQFDFPSYVLGDGQVGAGPVIITVMNSTANLDGGIIENVTVTVTSDTDPVGITLLLLEEDHDFQGVPDPDSGVFRNKNLIFMNGNNQFSLSQTPTISVTDHPANASIITVDLLPVTVISSSAFDIADPGIAIDLTETGNNTGIFTGTFSFTAGASSGNILHAEEGDIISVADTISGLVTNGIITPNPDAGVGAIRTATGETVTASYGILTADITIFDDETIPGGGGGGLVIHPGFVFDVAAVFGGGSSADKSPPSFTISRSWVESLQIPQLIMHSILDADPFKPKTPITDSSIEVPLRIGNNGYVPTGYSQTVETTIAETGTVLPLQLILYDYTGVEHVALYTNVAGIGGEIQNSDTYIIYNKYGPIEITDPHNLFADVKLVTSKEGIKYKFFFDITFAKPMDTSNIIFRIWDEKRNSADVKLFDAIKVVGEPITNNFVRTETTGIFIPYYKFPKYTIPIESNGNLIYYNSFGNLEQKQVNPYREPAIYPNSIGRSERIDDEFNYRINVATLHAQDTMKMILVDPFWSVEQKANHNPFFYPSNVGKLDRENIDGLNDAMVKEHAKATKYFSKHYRTNVED